MKSKALRVLTISLLAMVLMVSRAKGAVTYYVATNGNDSNSGTGPSAGSAFATIQHAINVVACGDTINIVAGSYDENVGIGIYPSLGIHSAFCASWGLPVTLQAYGSDYVTMHSSIAQTVIGLQSGDYPAATVPFYWIIKNIHCDGSVYMYRNSCLDAIGASYVRLDTVEISNFQETGGFIDNNNDSYDVAGWEFLNCNVHDTGQGGNDPATGAQPHGLYLTHVTGTLIDGGSAHDNFGYGYQLNAYNSTVRNTRIYNNNLDPTKGNGGMNIGNGTGNFVYNNLLWNNRAIALQVNSSCGSCSVYNNTVYGNELGIVVVPAGTSNTIVKNNISYNNSNAYDCGFGGANQYNIADCGLNSIISNNITTDPTFSSTTVGASDYLKLQSTSNAINAGANLTGLGISALDTDLAGTPRPDLTAPVLPWDSGAFQANGSTPTATLISVTPSSKEQGTAVTVTMVGSLTAFDGTSTAVISGSGVTASSYSASDNTHLTATFTITGGAATTARDVTVSTTGQPDVTKSGGFTVISALTPAITSVSPSQCVQGQMNVSVAVVGVNTNFVNGTTVLTAMSGITTNSVTVSNSTHVTLSLTCAGGASVGSRNIILVTNSETTTGGTNAFNVIQASSCAPPNLADASGIVAGQCTASTPDDGSGTVTEVTANLPSNVSILTGAYLVAGHVVAVKPGSFGDTTNTPLTSVTDSLGNTYTKCAGNPTNLTAQIEIWVAPSTHSGKPAVTFAHGGSTIFFSFGFLTEFYGLASSSPCDVTGSAAGSSTTPTIVSGSTTAAAEAIYAIVTSGASLVTENSPYTLIQAVTSNALEYKISGASGNTQTATFTTSNTAWIGTVLGLKPNSPNATIVSCVPTFGVTGAMSFSLSCAGSGTHWDGTTVPSFSNMGGISILSTNVTSATTLTFVFDISLGALIGQRDIIMTTGTEVAPLSNGFTINFSGTISRGAGRMKFK